MLNLITIENKLLDTWKLSHTGSYTAHFKESGRSI